ncbi:hypothetical protein ADICYQ_5382 [Cyclobacterium qasimii M12-11B]|uniref:Uncharacterized protein n=1 Tax=Cyclobacterium qasimii M12-11B TaxID=641524 RepID=S7V6A0_9BACT|nr:hypothetical protein ADICYQ_5382 [Cyclobacterium qasimii M12-11B]
MPKNKFLDNSIIPLPTIPAATTKPMDGVIFKLDIPMKAPQ